MEFALTFLIWTIIVFVILLGLASFNYIVARTRHENAKARYQESLL